MKNWSCLLVLVCLFGLVSAQEQQDPVKWTFDSDPVEGTKDVHELEFIAEIEEGWYVYASDVPEDGPIPTTFDIATKVQKVGGIEEYGLNKKSGFDAMFEMDITKYGTKVTFSQKIKTNTPRVVKGELQFMTCDNTQCLPPKTIPFEIVVPIIAEFEGLDEEEVKE